MSVLAAGLSDTELCAALRRGDERAFVHLVDLYHLPLRRLAVCYVRTEAVAEEVVQDTWLGVLKGIDRFEGRSSLRTWIYRILVNVAKSRGERESRTVPLSALAPESRDDEPAVDPSRFLDENHARWPGHWAAPPTRWDEIPEEHLLGQETLGVIRAAIDRLPATQRQVMVLRDVEGWTPDEISELLGLTPGNVRVLLHRARGKARTALERHFASS